MLDVKRLRVLREVAARGSFSGAADALSYTQSAISQQVAALEREAGTVLVERSARGVRLTQAGEALVAHADAILARLDAAERELEAIAGLRGGRVRVVAPPSIAASLLPPAIAEYRRRHPAVELSLRPADPEPAMAALRSGEADVAILLEGRSRPLAPEVVERRDLLEDPMYLVLPREHPLACQPALELADLAGDAWIQGTDNAACPDTALFLRACNDAGFEPQVAFQSDDYTAIQGFIAAGVGVALVPELALLSVRDDIAIRSVAPDPPFRRVLAATAPGAYVSPAAEAMLDILEETARVYRTRRDLALAS